MKREKTMSRWALAQRLQSLALALAADKPVRIGGSSVRVPERVTFEEKIESDNGEIEFELEIGWPGASGPQKGTAKRKEGQSKAKRK